MPALIVNADDFGLSKNVNRGIISCADLGCVTSTTLMVTGEAAQDAVQLALERQSVLGVGLHATFTQLRPALIASAVPSLVNSSGQFLSRTELLRRSLLRQVSVREVRAELRLQHDVMLDMGIAPTHIDSHQHVHALVPAIGQAVVELAEELSLPVRIPWQWAGKAPRSLRRWSTTTFLRRSIKRIPRLHSYGKSNDHFASVFDCRPKLDAISTSDYRNAMCPYEHSEGLLELMVHPAAGDNDFGDSSSFWSLRRQEYDALSAGHFADLLADMGFIAKNYSTAC